MYEQNYNVTDADNNPEINVAYNLRLQLQTERKLYSWSSDKTKLK